MKIDLVHDIQSVYRKTLSCMARPGDISSIKEECEKLDIDLEFYPSTLALMLMFLDGEVTFAIASDMETESVEFVKQMTFGKISKIEEADFIFILKDASPEKVEKVFTYAKIGDLLDPHKSATIVFEIESLSKDQVLAFKGPGIQEVSYGNIKSDVSWIKERKERNIEYPLGIDIIFTDKDSNIMCLPRTTQVFEEVI